MGWAIVLIGLLFAPIIWAFTKGRDVREVTEDHEGMTGYTAMIKNRDWQGPHGGSGGSG
jgi:hypothetical protein